MSTACLQRLADVIVSHTGAGGAGQFAAMFNTADRNAFDTAIVGDYALRYLSTDATLAPDDVVAIEGVDYVVVGHPERINSHEMSAQLMREA